MARWIVNVRSYCADPAHEKEFNDWYNNIHIPDILTCPGYISATRYDMETPATIMIPRVYMTTYEIETDDIMKTMQIRDERRRREAAIGGYSGGGQYVRGLGAFCYRLMYPTFTKDNTPPAPHAYKANPPK